MPRLNPVHTPRRPKGSTLVRVKKHTYLRRHRASGVLARRYVIWDKLEAALVALEAHIAAKGHVPHEAQALREVARKASSLI